ncbi:MAG: GNAT family protein [Cruoricaptor ignavus]|nr:GNAT family protein [Cruoricaptor ignavus]
MITIEKFTENDFEDLISWISNKEELMQFAGPQLTFPLTNEQLQEILNNKNIFPFKVIDSATNLPIGHAEIFIKDSSFSLARILIGDKNSRGKGLGKIIVEKLLDFGFTNLGKHTAELNVFDWNTSAIKCYEKVGFEINLTVKLERKMNGQIWTAIHMTIDKNKWENKRM